MSDLIPTCIYYGTMVGTLAIFSIAFLRRTTEYKALEGKVLSVETDTLASPLMFDDSTWVTLDVEGKEYSYLLDDDLRAQFSAGTEVWVHLTRNALCEWYVSALRRKEKSC